MWSDKYPSYAKQRLRDKLWQGRRTDYLLANRRSGDTLLASIMGHTPLKTLHYKRSRFVTQLPVDYLYNPSHAWIAPAGEGQWRAGLTKFATRMLGEMVDHGFEVESGAPVDCGQIIGWIEGFKAISDLFCIARGEFAGSNPVLREKIQQVTQAPYTTGWLYQVKGQPDSRCLDVQAYCDLLDKTIDRILARQKGETIQ